MKNKLLVGAAIVALVCAFIFTTCEMAVSTPPVEAALPTFTDEPASQTIDAGSDVHLSAAAEAPGGAAVSYEWYYLEAEYDDPTGTLLGEDDGAFQGSLDLEELEAGIYHYYVVVTNLSDGSTTTSNIVTVTVNDPALPVTYPEIKDHPSGGRFMAGEVTLSITAQSPEEGDEGELSYQWYSVNTAGTNKDGDKVNVNSTSVNETGARESKINLDTAGEYYFYCVVTKTIGDDSLSVTSHPTTYIIVAEMNPNATILLSNRKKQYVRGFGGMDIPWASFFEISEAEYEKMFNPTTGLGLNMMRIMIMPGIPDDDIGNGDNIERTMDYYVNGGGNRPLYYKGVQIVNKYDGYILASPWSPPAKWKTNDSINGGGELRPTAYQDYANYLKAFCGHMSEKDAPIYAISIQNEPNFTASYDGCEWIPPTKMRDFFIQVGHFTDGTTGYGGGKATPFVLTMNGETANNVATVNDPAMDNPISRAAIDVLGRHIYGDVLMRYSKALDVNPKKEVWMTEHNINSGSPPSYPNDSTWNYVWQFMNDVDVCIRLNDESAFIWWALKRFYSIIGEGQYGTTEGAILPRGYGLSHYSKFAKEMWRIDIAAQGTTAAGAALSNTNFNTTGFDRNGTTARVTAFMSDDGNSVSLVMYTPTNTNGSGGVDMGTVKIQMPGGFVARTATAIRSTAAAKAKREDVILSADGTAAFIMLPRSNIVSVRFTK
ncbi:MAG: hypothetical protein LBB72_01405 [Spirochaetaceae bacterium]|jgi:O-glycosyl hydrolase|nr:hypothetical protein [Spirochaetaceae bacterium]